MRWIAIAFGLALSAALALLWHFAAPLAAFDPAATSGESGSISILGYAHCSPNRVRRGFRRRSSSVH